MKTTKNQEIKNPEKMAAKARKMRANGKSYQEIAMSLGYSSESSVRRLLKKYPEKKSETTVVMTIEATFILKDGQTADSINLTDICPTADKVDLKKMQVFEKDE
jgi:transposase